MKTMRGSIKYFFFAFFLADDDPDIGMVAHHFQPLAVDKERKGIAGRDDAKLPAFLVEVTVVVDADFVGKGGVREELDNLCGEPVGQLVEAW